MEIFKTYALKWMTAILTVSLLLSVGAIGGLEAAHAANTNWYDSALEEATNWSIVPEAFGNASLNQPITRGEFAEVVVRAYISVEGDLPGNWNQQPFKDHDHIYGNIAYALGIVSGYPDGTFRPHGAIRREEMFMMIYKLNSKLGTPEAASSASLEAMHRQFSDSRELSGWATGAAAYVLQNNIVSGTTLNTLSPQQNTTRAQALVIAKNGLETLQASPVGVSRVNRVLHDLRNHIAASSRSGSVEWDSENQQDVSTARNRYDATRASTDTVVAQDPLLRRLGNNPAKYALIFGSANAARYQTAQEARKHMVTVTVDVWQLSTTGAKHPSKRSIVVHRAIADTVKLIFHEIYHGPEKFPIKSVGGYSWRPNPNSEHRWGLAIDINPNENYMIRSNGTIVAGSFWSPGTNPYSIRTDGDVVRAFKKYGFTWGGDAWPSSKDYMHFSFLGR